MLVEWTESLVRSMVKTLLVVFVVAAVGVAEPRKAPDSREVEEAARLPSATPLPESSSGDQEDVPAGQEGESQGPSPVEIRSRAFQKPVKFRSKGLIKAYMFKFDRDLKVTMAPIRTDGRLEGVAATVIEVSNNGKVHKGVLKMNKNGALRTNQPDLVNVANIAGIDPVLRAKLIKGAGPFKSRGQIEAGGTVRAVEFTHRRLGEVAEDGSMKVESASRSDDEKLAMTTVATLAPDGLPWIADTTGTLQKGPVSIQIDIHLTREGVPEQQAEE